MSNATNSFEDKYKVFRNVYTAEIITFHDVISNNVRKDSFVSCRGENLCNTLEEKVLRYFLTVCFDKRETLRLGVIESCCVIFIPWF